MATKEPTTIPKIGAGVNIPCIIHRTAKSISGISDRTAALIGSWTSMNPRCLHVIWDDSSMVTWMRASAPEFLPEFFSLRTGVERSDFFRYIVVSVVGGIYSDLDTECLRPASDWAFGQGGIDAIVGMEWDRPFAPGDDYQVVQWTFAASPNHRIPRAAALIVQDNVRRESRGERLWFSDSPPDNQIIKRTGPLAWTPAVQQHLNLFNVSFRQICDAQAPVRVGSLLVLPVWSFSPGVSHSRSRPPSDPQACVRHLFDGSWKNFS